jgi:hypothetical protein
MENSIKAEASHVENNHGGIEISLHSSGDTLYWRRNWGEDAITEWKEAEVHYSDFDNDGDEFENPQEYFTIGNVDDKGKEYMYFLSEFLRYDR